MRRLSLAVIAAVVASGARPAGCQTLVTPSSHWGALIYPELEPLTQFGLHFDRFTEFDKKKDGAGNPILTPYNGIHETIGFNELAISSTGKLIHSKKTLYRITIHGGYTSDQPSRFFQNDVIHRIGGLDPVPVGKTRNAFDGGISADLNHWWRGVAGAPIFAGVGAAFSTINNEVFVQGGFRAPRAGVSAAVRGGFVTGSDALPTRTLSSRYLTGQASVRLPLDDWLRALGGVIPELEVGTTVTTGLFADTAGSAIREHFVSLKVAWGPLTVETWNDVWSGKDQGPTFGLRVYFRSGGFASSRRL